MSPIKARKIRLLNRMAKSPKGRPRRSPELALEVLRLKNKGWRNRTIAKHFGWATQEDGSGRKGRDSRTVSRYLKWAHEIQDKQAKAEVEKQRQEFTCGYCGFVMTYAELAASKTEKCSYCGKKAWGQIVGFRR